MQPSDSRRKKKSVWEALLLARSWEMSGKRGKEDEEEGKRDQEEAERQAGLADKEKNPLRTRQTRVTWLGLGEEWAVW